MIGVSKLLYGDKNYGDVLRYSRDSHKKCFGTHLDYGPVVVWNITRTCNLKCKHCYSNSDFKKYDELTLDEGKELLRDLAAFKVPVVLFSGGEPLTSSIFFDLAEYAKSLGLRVTVSTNGTLITKKIAQKLKNIGVSYVGISLDGIGENNDRFRGVKGAFEEALKGIINCLDVRQKVGLRFTINRHNVSDLDNMFDLLVEENIPRVCFYHLVYSGRAIRDEDIMNEETRRVLDLIVDRTMDMHLKGMNKEVLTVDNHADGVYIYLKLKQCDGKRAETALELLKRNGGNRSGIAIGQVDWKGDVHIDQFTQNHKLGNVREKKFSEIWTDMQNEFLYKVRNRYKFIKGKCKRCKWFSVCNGNFRARAEAVYGDFWAQDPACYLTDEEIGAVETNTKNNVKTLKA